MDALIIVVFSDEQHKGIDWLLDPLALATAVTRLRRVAAANVALAVVGLGRGPLDAAGQCITAFRGRSRRRRRRDLACMQVVGIDLVGRGRARGL